MYLLLELIGYHKQAIIYDVTLLQWVIVDDPKKSNYNILGVFKPQTISSYIPKGLENWELFDPKCNGTRALKLTTVSTIFTIPKPLDFSQMSRY